MVAQSIVYAALLLGLTALQTLVNRHAPEAYMDEPFHVPQTQQYCRGDFLAWDPKITTLPGLYLLGLAHVTALKLLSPGATLAALCTTPYLRTVNLLLLPLSLYLIKTIHTRLHTHHAAIAPSYPLLFALTLSTYPLHFFYTFLYYTDVASTTFLLLTYYLALRNRNKSAALAGLAAVLIRQTNAVWVTFITAIRILHFLHHPPHLTPPTHSQPSKPQQPQDAHTTHTPSHNPQNHKSHDGSPPFRSITQSKTQSQAQSQSQPPPQHLPLTIELSTTLSLLWTHKSPLTAHFWPLLLIPPSFISFVLLNGGITVGDKQAHQPVTHLMQLQYFALCTTAMTAPVFLGLRLNKLWSSTRDLAQGVRYSPVRTVAGLAAAVAVSGWAVRYYTLAHPYLLADNRHYTFYVWRKWFAKGLKHRQLLVPAYLYCWYNIVKALREKCSGVWVLGYLLCCAATLVPAWLLEPRYFTPAYMILLLHIPPPSRRELLATVMVNLGVNAFTLYMFMYRPYAWADGSTARFMW